MGLAQQEAVVSLALSTGLVVVAIALAVWLHYERSHRETGLSPDDAVHFARQDVRRARVAIILGFLAIGIYVGSRSRTRRRPDETSTSFKSGSACPSW